MRARILLAVLLGLTGAPLLRAAGWEPVVVGVREDARPFAYRDRATGAFDGFLVDLCIHATVRAGRAPALRAVGHAERAAILDGAATDVDVLCDPTTVTLNLIRELSSADRPVRFGFSPIVFLANGSYVVNPKAARIEAPAGAADCLLAEPRSEPEEAEAGTAAPPTYAAAYLRGTTAGPVLRRAVRAGELTVAAPERLCLVAHRSHEAAVEAFCAGELKYWFGDAAILRATIDWWTRETGAACAHEFGRSLSYEPYALLVSSRLPGFRDAFSAGLYELFAKGLASKLLETHFDTSGGVSPALETLFRINSIPSGLAFWSEPDDDPPEAEAFAATP